MFFCLPSTSYPAVLAHLPQLVPDRPSGMLSTSHYLRRVHLSSATLYYYYIRKKKKYAAGAPPTALPTLHQGRQGPMPLPGKRASALLPCEGRHPFLACPRPLATCPLSPQGTPNRGRLAFGGKSRRRRAYPQQIVTTRLLYCLQDPFAHLSRLQRI